LLHVNPSIPADYPEIGAWLLSLARSHAKREDSRIEAQLEANGPREGRSYGLRLALGARTAPPPGSPPLELEFREVVEGRTRFAWCLAFGERVQTVARGLVAAAPGAG
jgi:hypothetical protein